MLGKQKKWYAIYTKPRHEKKVYAILLKKGIESWCPVKMVERQWSDRKKIIEEPLFKSYVFVHISEKERVDTLMTDGALNLVHFLGRPAIIRDYEIDTIKKYLAEKDVNIHVISGERFKENDKVKISKGIFMDNEGTVLHANKKKVYVQLQGLGQIMVVEFPVEFLVAV